MNSGTTLITGASSGIGLELAREFARNGHSLVLVAPVATELESIAAQLTRDHGVEVRPLAKDLENPASAEKIYQELEREGVTIDILVNNAGKGQQGAYAEIPLEKDLGILRLNVEAVLRLTKLFLPPMLARGEGKVLMTASVASFEPGPLMAVYHASKAFVLSLSESLATELEDTGVTVTALCPGPVDTDFFPKADMVGTRVFQKGNVMAPQEVAKVGYDAVMRGERVIVPGGMNKVMVASRRLLPESAQAKKNQKYYEEVPAEDRKREPGDIASKSET